MIYYIVKVLSSAIIIVLISEISKKNTFIGSVLASLPLVSVLAFIWIYIDTGNVQKIAELSKGVFWLVIPSLSMFIILPIMLEKGFNFYLSLAVSLVVMILLYFLMTAVLDKFGIKI